MLDTLRGRRLVIVGASAGVGRAVALRALRAGAEVLLVARREDRLLELLDESGSSTGTVVPADITDPVQCGVIAGAASAIGPIDLVIMTTGVSRLQPMAAMTGPDWEAILRTNLVGVNQMIAALLPHLATDGLISVLSSESVDRPRAGLGAYGASKAALESSLQAWRAEHAPVRFTCIAIGATMPTEVSDDYDPGLLAEMLDAWFRHGLIQSGFMHTEELAQTLLEVLVAVHASPSVGLDRVVLRSPAPVISGIPDAAG